MTETAIVTLAIPTITATGSDQGAAHRPDVMIALVMPAEIEIGGLQQGRVREVARYVRMPTFREIQYR
jgi:hypothetical protein